MSQNEKSKDSEHPIDYALYTLDMPLLVHKLAPQLRLSL